jgi:hypothetical protein
MHRAANIERDLTALDRILAGLLLLAGLADHAAASPYPVRCAMLWGLRRADARVKDFAGSYPVSMGLPRRWVVTAFDGNDRDAALSLAMSLRVLASAIRDMIVRLRLRQFLLGRRVIAGDRLDRQPRCPTAGMGRVPASFAGCPDTS